MFGIGLITAIFVDGGWVVWWHQDWQFHLFFAGYHVGAMLLAGVVLAAIVKPAQKPVE